MQEKPSEQPESDAANNSLKLLSAAEFAALGGDAVAFVRAISGQELDAIVAEADFEADQTYQLVMSADGTPLLVTDTTDSVVEWLDDKNLGLVAVH